jgi:hypothetical protein
VHKKSKNMRISSQNKKKLYWNKLELIVSLGATHHAKINYDGEPCIYRNKLVHLPFMYTKSSFIFLSLDYGGLMPA